MTSNTPRNSTEDRHWITHLGRLEAPLAAESPRAAGMLACALLDHHLKSAIAQSLVDDPKAADALLQEAGPLGTLSARIDMVYMLGLIPDDMRRELHTIRRIRNRFAHESEHMDFSDNSVRDLCSNILGARRYYSESPELEPKTRYIRACFFAVYALYFAIEPGERPAAATTARGADGFDLIF